MNLRFRYHHDPKDAGAGPRITAADLRDPREADFTNVSDKGIVEPVVVRLAQEYESYVASGSTSWDQTIDVRQRPGWMHEIIGADAPPTSGAVNSAKEAPR